MPLAGIEPVPFDVPDNRVGSASVLLTPSCGVNRGPLNFEYVPFESTTQVFMQLTRLKKKKRGRGGLIGWFCYAYLIYIY